MKILKSMSEFLDNLDLRDFYKYIGIALGITLLFVSFIVYRFYSNVGYYKKQIQSISNQREEIQELLEKAALIKEQKKDVNNILEAEPNFKIAGYFDNVLAELQLTSKKDKENEVTPPQELGEQDYNERILSAYFSNMNMKELSELLNVLEQNKRVYTKELEMQRSQKKPPSLKVKLTIATLEPRSKPTEFEE